MINVMGKPINDVGRYLKTHGKSNTHVYRSWSGAKNRCTNPKNKDWENYGGRGIIFCDRWSKFENFLKDMGEPPTPKHSIDRIDTNQGYSPNNCRWATWIEQQNNSNNVRYVTYNNTTLSVAQWSRKLGTPYQTIIGRLNVGWDIERALLTPSQKQRSF